MSSTVPLGGSSAADVRRLRAILRVDARAQLGEGPTWDPATGQLRWVDILGSRVHRFRPADGLLGPSLATGRHVGAAVPRAHGGLVLALAGGFAFIEPGTDPAEIADPRAIDASASAPVVADIEITIPVEADRPENRMNDAKCDPAGRLWAGTMAYAETAGAGRLYRLDPDGRLTTMLEHVTISNGLGWSPDGRTMYYIDSGSGGVDAFRYDLSAGAIDERRQVVAIAPADGVPDGLTVDSEGALWVALWGGGAVHRYLPDGTLDQIVELPCRLVTSCAFGGDRLGELFITTATVGLTDAELAAQPGAGGVFSCRPGGLGLPATPFAG